MKRPCPVCHRSTRDRRRLSKLCLCCGDSFCKRCYHRHSCWLEMMRDLKSVVMGAVNREEVGNAL
jgi:uncharacterized UBP type Zn finger protein